MFIYSNSLVRLLRAPEGDGGGGDPAPDPDPGGGGGDPEPVKFTVDGKEYSEAEVIAMRDGQMRQADYTTKTTAVAEKEKELDKALAGVKVFDGLLKTMQTDPDAAKREFDLIVGHAGRNRPAEGGENDEKFKALEEEIADFRLDQQLAALRANEDFAKNEGEILEMAEKRKIGNVEHAFEMFKGIHPEKFAVDPVTRKRVVVTEGAKGAAGGKGGKGFKFDSSADTAAEFKKYEELQSS